MAQYIHLDAIKQEIDNITTDDSESVVDGLWISILTWEFPIEQGYVTRPQARHGTQPGKRGWSDLHTYQYTHGTGSPRKFLIVQCKRPSRERQRGAWRDGRNQLEIYFRATYGGRQGEQTPAYGILAIGRLMKAYKNNDNTNRIRRWAPPGVKTCPKGHHISGNARKIKQILDHIRRDH
ncbi:hypothetical protein PHISCL_02940 [Aspergillus sclerotialis]|uniref:Restriction endonuclease n=1 Tax=Aspergillus sclerotialis TaxID=2070753 RepID=A0A3A3A5T9_9EURO|nr:hypothetical protein PHISCL_02940 [Aspergillus sclerotialis]